MRRKTKENLIIFLTIVVLLVITGLIGQFLTRQKGKDTGTASKISEDFSKQGWDVSLWQQIKKIPQISVKLYKLSSSFSHSKLFLPFTFIQEKLFNWGVPLWLMMLLSYLLFPLTVAAIGWLMSVRLWQTCRGKGRFFTITTVFFFFLLCGLVVFSGIRGKFNEFLVAFVICFLIPGAIRILLKESQAKKKRFLESSVR